MTQQQNNRVVRFGMIIGIILTVVIYPLLYFAFPHFNYEVNDVDRLVLAVYSLIFPGLFLVLLIIRIGSMRFGNPSEDPTQVVTNSQAMQINLRVLSNTHEQLSIFVINAFGLALLLPFQYLSLVPIYAGLFLLGRLMYWLGYRHDPLWRAPGFALNIIPSLLGIIYCCVAVLADVL